MGFWDNFCNCEKDWKDCWIEKEWAERLGFFKEKYYYEKIKYSGRKTTLNDIILYEVKLSNTQIGWVNVTELKFPDDS